MDELANKRDLLYRKGLATLLMLMVLVFGTATAVYAKESLVLLPVQAEGLTAQSKEILRTTLYHSLAQRYQVSSGEAVDAKLRVLAQTGCEVMDCLYSLSKTFNRSLLGRVMIVADHDDYLISLEIKNIFTDAVVESATATCPFCELSDVVTELKNLADGANINRIDTVDHRSVAVSVDRRQLADQGNSDFAMLVFDSTPAGVAVEIDGGAIGQTPMQYFEVAIGQKISVTLSKTGYLSETMEFIVEPGANEFLNLSLEQAMASVIVTTEPYERGANIYLGQGEQIMGRVPAQLQLPEGEYSLWVEGLASQGQRTIRVLAGQRQNVIVELTSANILTSINKQPGSVFQDVLASGGRGPEMVVIPPGQFQMGDIYGQGDGNELPLRNVRLDKSFALGKTEITKAQFRQFVRATNYLTDAENSAADRKGCYVYLGEFVFDWQAGSDWLKPGFKQADDEPVVCVSWNDANEYVGWLNQQTNQHYRLPTEAEWEYAARAASDERYSFGSNEKDVCQHGNVADHAMIRKLPDWLATDCNDGHIYTAAVASYQANAFGLFDMHGNVWEWTQDCWHESYGGAPQDGSAWFSGDCDKRVVRGGAWTDSADHVRSANRIRNAIGDRYLNNGFRLARDL